MSAHSPTHWSQMYTPGPAITFLTSEPGLAQNEQRTWTAVVGGRVPPVMVPPGESRHVRSVLTSVRIHLTLPAGAPATGSGRARAERHGAVGDSRPRSGG